LVIIHVNSYLGVDVRFILKYLIVKYSLEIKENLNIFTSDIFLNK